MLEVVVSALVFAGLGYLGLGLAHAFAARGAARLDPDADGATLGFRILLIPGAAAFWPLLLKRWMRGAALARARRRRRCRSAPWGRARSGSCT